MFKNDITELIGGTPLLRLTGTNIFAKLEYFNPLHSVKDRAAKYMIDGAERRGLLKKGGVIIEATSGNTGIALAYIGALRGYKTILVMPDNMSAERIALLRIIGAEVVLTPAALGMTGAREKVEELKTAMPESFVPDQFSNLDNRRAHIETTAPEIIDALGEITPDFFTVTFGSGGTVSGTAKALKARYPSIKIVAAEPAESPLLTEGRAAPHKIQGVGANLIPALYDPSLVDEVITITGDEAYRGAFKTVRTYGAFVGISSGANLAAAEKLASRDPSAVIVTLFPDTGERYLSLLKAYAEQNQL